MVRPSRSSWTHVSTTAWRALPGVELIRCQRRACSTRAAWLRITHQGDRLIPASGAAPSPTWKGRLVCGHECSRSGDCSWPRADGHLLHVQSIALIWAVPACNLTRLTPGRRSSSPWCHIKPGLVKRAVAVRSLRKPANNVGQRRLLQLVSVQNCLQPHDEI